MNQKIQVLGRVFKAFQSKLTFRANQNSPHNQSNRQTIAQSQKGDIKKCKSNSLINENEFEKLLPQIDQMSQTISSINPSLKDFIINKFNEVNQNIGKIQQGVSVLNRRQNRLMDQVSVLSKRVHSLQQQALVLNRRFHSLQQRIQFKNLTKRNNRLMNQVKVQNKRQEIDSEDINIKSIRNKRKLKLRQNVKNIIEQHQKLHQIQMREESNIVAIASFRSRILNKFNNKK